jgi:hypothetical protein
MRAARCSSTAGFYGRSMFTRVAAARRAANAALYHRTICGE